MWWFKLVKCVADGINFSGRFIVEAETAYNASCQLRLISSTWTHAKLCKNIYGPYKTKEEAEKDNPYDVTVRL